MGLSERELVSFANLAAADQLDRLAHHLNKLVVVFSNLTKQFDLVFGYKLKPVEIVAKLIELAQRSVERSLFRYQEGGGNTVKLGCGVVLKLALGSDFSLDLHKFFGAAVGVVQDQEADGADRDKQHHDGKKGREQLRVNPDRHARDNAR